MKTLAKFAAAAIAAATLSTTAHAVPVSLELYLAADVSGSISDADFDLQRLGFASAFQSAAVKNAIAASGTRLSLIPWRNPRQAISAVPRDPGRALLGPGTGGS
jgi:hypothetical protein